MVGQSYLSVVKLSIFYFIKDLYKWSEEVWFSLQQNQSE